MKKLLSGLLAALVLSALCLSSNAATTAQIKARDQLVQVLPYYDGYTKKVTLAEYQSNAEFQYYVNTLLPRAHTYAYGDNYYPASAYTNLIDALEQSWQTWRAQMPLSMGLYKYRSDILNQVGDVSQYDSALYSRFSSALTNVIDMIDDVKNNLYATDYDGQQALAALQGLVDELKSGKITTTSDILLKKKDLMGYVCAFRHDLERDTKVVKSPETVTFEAMIQSASALVGKTTATQSEITAFTAKLTSYYYDTFQVALFIGNAFINTARKAYYKVSPDSELYTQESWNEVSNAIDYCDNVKNSWHTDVDCLYAYNLLLNAIDKLQLKEIKVYPITVSHTTADAGDEISVKVTVSAGSDMIYGNFSLAYDSTVLEYTGSSESKAIPALNAVSLRYENVTAPVTDEYIWTVSFKVKDFAVAGTYPLTLTCEKLRDSNGALIAFETVPGTVIVSSQNQKGDLDESGNVGLNDVIGIARLILNNTPLSERQKYLCDIDISGSVSLSDLIAAAKTNLGTPIALPTEYTVTYVSEGQTLSTSTGQIYSTSALPPIPEKSGYVFQGWYTDDGLKAQNDVYICGGQTLHAKWKVFEAGPLRKDEVSAGAFVAIHNAYAVEDDFYMLAECGVDFIILDYTHNDPVSEQCLHWAEKYGIKVLIHDFALNALTTFTEYDVQTLTSAYRSSPAFAGNNLWDEPHYYSYPEIAQKMDVYTSVLPGYDMHVNLFPSNGVETFMGVSFEYYLNQFTSTVSTTNHLCQDPYPLLDRLGERRIDERYYNDLKQGAAAARANNLDYWIYIQTMTGVAPNVYPDLTDLRFQAYACLAFGASKIVHYCYDVPGYNPDSGYSAQVYAMRDYAHNYTKLWDYGQILHTELDTIAQAYEAYTYIDTYSYNSVAAPAYLLPVPAYTAQEISIQSCNTPLLIGTFDKKDGSGSKAVMLTNAGEPAQKGTATVSFSAPAASVTVYSDGLCRTLQPINGIYTLTLDPGAGAFVTF